MNEYPRATAKGNIVEKCKKCGNTFTIEKDNLEFYRKHGLTPPKTCPACLLEKKARRNTDGHRKRAFTKDGLLDIFPGEDDEGI